MKEEWLLHGAVVPVDVETTSVLVAEIHRLIGVVGGMALTQQEPLEYWNAVEGWVKIDEVREHFDSVGCGTIYKTAGEGREPLYTTPPQRKPLTDEQIQTAARNGQHHHIDFRAGVQFAEAAHGIKE